MILVAIGNSGLWASCFARSTLRSTGSALPCSHGGTGSAVVLRNGTLRESVAFVLQTLRTGPTDYDPISVALRTTTVHFLRSHRSSREEYLLGWDSILQGVLCSSPLGILFALLLTGCARSLRIALKPFQMASAGVADLKLQGPEGTPEAASPDQP